MSTLACQRETGGKRARTLPSRSDVLRKRSQMKLKIHAMSSVSKASAYIVGALPFIVFFMIWWINPVYIGKFFTDDRLTVAGLGGAMASARLYAANGLQLGQAYELDAIAAVILGGTSFVGGIGSVWGTLVGALIIAVLTNGLILTGVPDVWQYIVKGLIIIGAVALDRFRLEGGVRT